ncbi:MAG: TetR/AcrR family transcriptional regulator [Celeribacter sp.]|jgi:TetR/AcrR family transcriptional repressor of nem operon
MIENTSLTKAEQTRALILSTGRELVLARGFSGVGLKDILTSAQVPKGSFYYYFASKDAFGAAMLADYVAEYLDGFDRIVAAPGTAGDRLDAFFSRALGGEAGSMAQRCLVVKLAAEIADLSEAMRCILDDGINQLCARLATLLEDGAVDGSLCPQTDSSAAARLLYAQWLGAAILAKLARDPAPLEQALIDTRRRFLRLPQAQGLNS